MNGFEFAAELVGHLIWPAVALAALVMLRKPLATRISQLRSVSAGSFGAEFGEAEDKVERALEADADADMPGDSEPAEAKAPRTQTKADPERLDGQFIEIALRADDNPSYAVVAAWSALETIMASALADVMPLNDRRYVKSSRPIRGATVTRVLLETRVISPEGFEAIAALRELRNEVAHGALAPEPGAAAAYVRSVSDMANAIWKGVNAVWRRHRETVDADGEQQTP